MTLYFFINCVMKEYYETGKMNHECDPNHEINGRTKHNDSKMAKKLRECLLNEAGSQRADDNILLYNELLFIAKSLDEETPRRFMSQNKISYLNLVSFHYFHENNPVILLKRLLVTADVNMIYIKRILNYPMFRGWVTLKAYIRDYKTHIMMEAKQRKFFETELFIIFKAELYCNGLISHFYLHELAEEKPKRKLSIESMIKFFEG